MQISFFSLMSQPKTNSKVNSLYHDNGLTTTHQIKDLLSQYERVCLIVDETSSMDYNIPSIQKTSIYKVIYEYQLQEKIVTNFKKFIMLVKQGFIKPNSYNIFIFRLHGMSKELMECFKIFYHYSTEKNLSIGFFNTIEKLDYIYMGCKGDEQFTNVCNIFVEPVNDPDATKYTKLKSKIINTKSICPAVKNKIEELENITYKYALFYIEQNFKLEDWESENIQPSPMLSINDFKFKNTLQILHENKGYKIYLKCHNRDIIKFLNLQTNQNDTVIEYHNGIQDVESSILVIYDTFENLDYNVNFYKIFIYHENYRTENLNALFNNFGTDATNVSYLTEKYLREKLIYTSLSDTGAFYDFTSSYTILQHFFYLLHQMLKKEYFYLKCFNLNCDIEENSGEFRCKLSLPKLHEEFKPITSTYQANKLEAKKHAAYEALHFLRLSGFMDNHLCPVQDKFVKRNKLYYRYICDIYSLEIKENKSGSPGNFLISVVPSKVPMDISIEMYIEAFGIDNSSTKAVIEKMKDDYTLEKIKEINMTPEKIKNMFERDHRIDTETDQPAKAPNILFNVIQPNALSSFDKIFHLYQCRKNACDGSVIDCQLGICTGQSFSERLKYHDSEIWHIGTYEFTDDELSCLLFFQTVLFLLNFKRIKLVNAPSKEYCYFFVPLKNGKIDIDYLKEFRLSNFLLSNLLNLKDKELLKSNLLFNPYNKKFYLYDKPCDIKITDNTNIDATTSYIDYFENKYGAKLKSKIGENLLFSGFMFDSTISSQPNILSSEILYVTSMKIDFCKNFHQAKSFLYAFEKMALAFDLKKKMNLKIQTQYVLKCLSAKDQDFDNYERLEFLGDSVLKFVCSKYLFNYDLGDCVTKKDSLISNESLFKVAKKHGIVNYFSFIKYSDVLFQPPSILKYLDDKRVCDSLEKCIEYYDAKNIFLSRNVTFQEHKVNQPEIKTRGFKTYADIIEALIGAYFVELGFDESEKFIKTLGITQNPVNNATIKCSFAKKLEKMNCKNENHRDLEKCTDRKIEDKDMSLIKKLEESDLHTKMNIQDHLSHDYFNSDMINELKKHQNVLSSKEIHAIEKILNYKFLSVGLIEKAMIHPSSHNNILGSTSFNKLELLGDCALDLVVTEKIYHELQYSDPEGMHCKRKSLVNNFSLARVLFKMKLDNYLHICFDDKHKLAVKKKLQQDGESVNKAYGDVFESICGAILMDMSFDYGKYKKYIMANIYKELEACSDATR